LAVLSGSDKKEKKRKKKKKKKGNPLIMHQNVLTESCPIKTPKNKLLWRCCSHVSNVMRMATPQPPTICILDSTTENNSIPRTAAHHYHQHPLAH